MGANLSTLSRWDRWAVENRLRNACQYFKFRYDHGQTPSNLYPFSAIPPWGITLVGHIQGTRVNGVDRLGRVRLTTALPHIVEVGTLRDELPLQTREAIGELGEGYSLVVPLSSPGTTQGNRCFILVFDDFRRTDGGGLETQARFYRTARTPYAGNNPRHCVPPIYPGGIGSSYTVPAVTKPHAVTRLLIY